MNCPHATFDDHDVRADPVQQDAGVQPHEPAGQALPVRSTTEHWVVESLQQAFSKEVLRASLDRQMIASAAEYAAGLLTASAKAGRLDREEAEALEGDLLVKAGCYADGLSALTKADGRLEGRS